MKLIVAIAHFLRKWEKIDLFWENIIRKKGHFTGKYENKIRPFIIDGNIGHFLSKTLTRIDKTFKMNMRLSQR